jgi:hypothetical protein
VQLVAGVEVFAEDHGDPVDQLLHRGGADGEHAHPEVLGADGAVR